MVLEIIFIAMTSDDTVIIGYQEEQNVFCITDN